MGVLFGTSAAHAIDPPEAPTLQARLATELPSYWSVVAFSIEASANYGNDVEPLFRQRIVATIAPAVDLFVADGRLGDTTFLVRTVAAGEPRPMFLLSSSTLRAGAWQPVFERESDPTATAGSPREAFAGPTVVRATEEEVQYLAAIDANAERARQAQQAETERQREAAVTEAGAREAELDRQHQAELARVAREGELRAAETAATAVAVAAADAAQQEAFERLAENARNALAASVPAFWEMTQIEFGPPAFGVYGYVTLPFEAVITLRDDTFIAVGGDDAATFLMPALAAGDQRRLFGQVLSTPAPEGWRSTVTFPNVTPATGAPEPAQALASETAPGILTMLATANPAAGQALVLPCTGCHTFAEGEATRVGPNLYDIVGALVGGKRGFNYSPAMVALNEQGATWDYRRLDDFLRNPAQGIAGSRMMFPGIASDRDRAHIIAYLRSLSRTPAPLPAPVPAAAVGPASVPALAATPAVPASAAGFLGFLDSAGQPRDAFVGRTIVRGTEEETAYFAAREIDLERAHQAELAEIARIRDVALAEAAAQAALAEQTAAQAQAARLAEAERQRETAAAEAGATEQRAADQQAAALATIERQAETNAAQAAAQLAQLARDEETAAERARILSEQQAREQATRDERERELRDRLATLEQALAAADLPTRIAAFEAAMNSGVPAFRLVALKAALRSTDPGIRRVAVSAIDLTRPDEIHIALVSALVVRGRISANMSNPSSTAVAETIPFDIVIQSFNETTNGFTARLSGPAGLSELAAGTGSVTGSVIQITSNQFSATISCATGQSGRLSCTGRILVASIQWANATNRVSNVTGTVTAGVLF